MILLNPGPVTLSPRVRQALLKPDLCHREPEFFALQDAIRAKLLSVYGLDPARHAAVLLSGSGTAAVEAMIASLAPAEGALLVMENGVYGERIARMAEVHGIALRRLHYEWGAAIMPADVERELAAHPDIRAIAMVHHETTTGRLNDLEAIGALCKSHRIAFLIDGVSSFAAEELDFEGWNIGACAATTNKCLHGVPGVAFVIVCRGLLKTAQTRALYLDLAAWCKAQDAQGTPFTPAVQSFYALDEALDEFKEQGGWQARRTIYRQRARRIETTLTRSGVQPLLSTAESSAVLRAWHLPQGLSYTQLHDALKAHGFVIYAGQGKLADWMFRISLMGDIGEQDLERLSEALELACRKTD